MQVLILDYGLGNIKSIQFAFERLGATTKLSAKKEDIFVAQRVVLPGVGQAKNAMQKIQELQLKEVITKIKKPVLGICLGMQLMCRQSDEGNVEGLGIFETDVLPLPLEKAKKVPHIGWNEIYSLETPIFKDIPNKAFMYFAHSYYIAINHTIAKTNYGITFSSALKKDNFYGLQFHPEKSGRLGAQILKNFLHLTT